MKTKLVQEVLIRLMFISLAGITAAQKISGASIPNWFSSKFEATIIGKIPYLTEISFILITTIELLVAVLMLISFFKFEFKDEKTKRYTNLSLDLSLLLFLLLFTGSFIAEDYQNGALDFLYFTGTLYIKNKILSSQ
jgi:hypothetical protein